MALLVEYGQAPGSRLLELVQNRGHLFILIDNRRRLLHQVIDVKLLVGRFIEEVLAQVIHLHQALEHPVLAHNRKNSHSAL